MNIRILKKIIQLLLLLLLTNQSFSQQEDYKLLDRIVAIIKKDDITEQETLYEVNKEINLLKKNNLDYIYKEIYKKNLNLLIEKKLIEQYASEKNITVNENEIDLVIQNVLDNNQIDLETLKKELKKDNIDFKSFKSDIAYNLLLKKLKDNIISPYIKVSEYEIDGWLKNDSKKSNIEYEVFHILIKDRKKSFNIREQLNSQNFENFALEHSVGPNANNGGNLGWKKIEEFPNIFSEIIKKMNPGEISPIIESSNGFHILKLNSLKNNKKIDKLIVSKYKLMQILLKKDLISNDDDLQKKLIRIKKLIDADLKFEDAVNQYSQDKSFTKSDNLPWISYNTLPEEFKKSMKDYPEKIILGPFKSEIGWHLIKIYDFKEEDLTSQSIRDQAKLKILADKAEIRFKDWLINLKEISSFEILNDQ